ncbi:MAG: hypothetical protein ACM3PD_07750, partial [Chloroflexota bacterium]
QALALAVGAPSSTDWTNATGVHAGLTNLAKTVPNSCYKFMVGELGGRYNVGGVTLETVNARVALTLNLPAEAAPGACSPPLPTSPLPTHSIRVSNSWF